MAHVDEPVPSAARRHEHRTDLGRPRHMQTVCATELDGHRTGNATGARPLLAPHRVCARPLARWPRVVTLTLSLCASILLELASLTACESVPSHAAATRTRPSPMQSLTPYPTPTS